MAKRETQKNAGRFREAYLKYRTTPASPFNPPTRPDPRHFLLDPERDKWVIAQMMRSVELQLEDLGKELGSTNQRNQE